MLKETMDTNSSNENYAERFAVSIIEEQIQSNTGELKEIKNIQAAVHLNIEMQQPAVHLLKQLDSIFFNEMTDDHVLSPETAEKVEHWLSQHSIYELEKLNETAKAHFLYQGITFAVYGEKSGIDRTIPFDLIPRVIAKQQWNKIEAGCTQRIKALNLFLADIYHEQNILREGFIPELPVLSHEAYQPIMMNHSLNGNIYSQISGIDIVRDRHGEFFVLEDNLRTPSGVSYMIESRKMSQKLMPELCNQQVASIEQYPQLLREILAENSRVTTPTIVVLTPGRYNSAYYEHSFLAREMGVPLVTSRDLFVENDKVYVKTIRGRQQVDVIYRRLDDGFLDPLCFRPDSTLGVAGLMSAYLSGNVVIANAPGTGVADDKSIYPYVDQMIAYYLNEKPILSNVPTYQCRDADALDYVLANLDQLVVKEAQGSGGYGMLIGPKATEQEIDLFRIKLMASPSAYIAQPTLDLSVAPTLTSQGIAERHIDLRPFILTSPERIEIVPGGLTRVAMQQGSLVVNSSQGGGIKDTWVIDEYSI
ncbi:circularly permuted type 2 ATP-grasp protein [Acinetobacter bereziniae]|uniref:circularly permuted type 2 ATP-grasp protein n=1 Tax=Acinetobacter bereziniae TaxID=106648 RepID=UPI00124FEB6A|nr:circularly permuted type 2 ATP-grasp protein [Acinetobacter bereziniae]